MQKFLMAFAVLTSLAAAAPVLAMTASEYQTERERMKDDFSHRFVDCIDYSGMERARCQSNIRKERDTALRDLKKNYQSSKEPDPLPIRQNP